MQSHNLVDIWRFLYPTKRDFSCFSAVHKSDSRIDYFLLDSMLLASLSSCAYHNILISDHAPVSLNLTLNCRKGRYSWRLNNTALKDEEFCSYISREIETYLITNDTGGVDVSVLWEDMKAVLMGRMICTP